MAGLALAGGDALRLAQRMYGQMYQRLDELAQPYATVIEIDRRRLPAPHEVGSWTGAEFAAALRHDPREPRFNPHFRQLVHVGFRVAAEHGAEFLSALQAHRGRIGELVTENLYAKHLQPLFLAAD
jgi:hypothetical protein